MHNSRTTSLATLASAVTHFDVAAQLHGKRASDGSVHLDDCTASPAGSQCEAHMAEVANAPCSCWEDRWPLRFILDGFGMWEDELVSYLEGLGRFESDVSELEVPATKVIQLRLRADWLAHDPRPAMASSSAAQRLLDRRDAARGQLLEDFRRLKPEVDLALASQALVLPDLKHDALAPARSVLEAAFESARAAVASSSQLFLVRCHASLPQRLVSDGRSFLAFALESSHGGGDVYTVSSALRAALKGFSSFPDERSISDEVTTTDASDVLEAAAVLASADRALPLASALAAARAF